MKTRPTPGAHRSFDEATNTRVKHVGFCSHEEQIHTSGFVTHGMCSTFTYGRLLLRGIDLSIRYTRSGNDEIVSRRHPRGARHSSHGWRFSPTHFSFSPYLPFHTSLCRYFSLCGCRRCFYISHRLLRNFDTVLLATQLYVFSPSFLARGLGQLVSKAMWVR